MKVHGVFLVAVFFYLAYTQLVDGQPRKDCQTSCGNVAIEYPFGTSQDCYYADERNFKLTCNEKEKLVFGNNFEVIDISTSGELRVMNNISYTCYDSQGNSGDEDYYTYTLTNVSLSHKNKFTIVGCNAYAYLSTYGIQNYSTGCISGCDSPPATNGGCHGAGCCSTDVSVPSDSNKFRIRSFRLQDTTSVYGFSPCTYAFLAENGTFHFDALGDLKNLRNVSQFPMVLDWSIGNQTCEEVGNRSMCGMRNSTCFNSNSRPGYNCKCIEGYEGNPYLGCLDIDECTTNSTIHKHNCSDPSTCRNMVGGFDCKCRSGYHLDTTTMSCKRKDFGWATILLGTTIGFLSILLVVSYVQQRRKHRKTTELRKKFFEQNGGGMNVVKLLGCCLETEVPLLVYEFINSGTLFDHLHEERPLMTDVAAKLEGLRVTRTKHQWSDQYRGEATENLVGVDILSAQGDTSSTGYDSIKNVASMHIAAGR
ncbi:hypothetical protein Bca4012_054147 [Brassica carinata]